MTQYIDSCHEILQGLSFLDKLENYKGPWRNIYFRNDGFHILGHLKFISEEKAQNYVAILERRALECAAQDDDFFITTKDEGSYRHLPRIFVVESKAIYFGGTQLRNFTHAISIPYRDN